MNDTNRKDQIRQWADDMFDLLVANPAGLTRDDIMSRLSIPTVGDFHDAKGILQDKCGATDSITVVGDSTTAMKGGWTWSLQGDPANVIGRQYQIRKWRNLFGRERRAYMVVTSIVRRTPGNSAIGRSIRRAQRSIYNTMTEISDALVELGAAPPSLPPPP